MSAVDSLPESDQEIERYGVLTTPAGRELQALVDLAAQVFDVPSAAINLITGTSQHQVAAAGFEPSICSREDSMCAAVLEEPSPVVVADARLDARFSRNPFVTGDIGDVRFYASAPLLTPAGVPLGRLCVFDDSPRETTPDQHEALAVLASRVMDVLELRLRSEQLERSLIELTRVRDELRRSNEALLHFAGQVSHDLRNPLQAVQANAELLADEPAVRADPAMVRAVADIRTASADMASMIDKVLTAAREGGTPRASTVDLGAVAERVLRDLAVEIDRAGATVDLDPLPQVVGDEELLHAVLLNLLSNALKFSRPGVQPKVTIQAERRAGAHRVGVSDNGVGVPPGQERAVFLPYVRVQDADEQRVPGHGIGLATVRRIVSAHGGQVGLEPSTTGGTTVWFEVPDRS